MRLLFVEGFGGFRELVTGRSVGLVALGGIGFGQVILFGWWWTYFG